MDEYEFVAIINLIAANNSCYAYSIDFKTRMIRIEGPEEAQVACSIAISDFMDSIGEITEVNDDEIQMVKKDVGWVL